MRANPPCPAFGLHGLRVMQGRPKRVSKLELAAHSAFLSTKPQAGLPCFVVPMAKDPWKVSKAIAMFYTSKI